MRQIRRSICVALGAVALFAVDLATPGLAAAATKDTVNLKPGSTFKECRNCPDMVVIPAGKFVMGTPEDQEMHEKDEYQHEVTIAKPFALSKTEVTWDQWEACVRDNACDGAAVDAALRLDRDGKPDPELQGLGPRQSSRRRRELVRRAALRRLAESQDR